MKEPLLHLEELINRLQKVGLVVNMAKSEFGKVQVTFPGRTIGYGQNVPRDVKTKVIGEFPCKCYLLGGDQ